MPDWVPRDETFYLWCAFGVTWLWLFFHCVSNECDLSLKATKPHDTWRWNYADPVVATTQLNELIDILLPNARLDAGVEVLQKGAYNNKTLPQTYQGYPDRIYERLGVTKEQVMARALENCNNDRTSH